uniref:Uncharacterized protein n=1 Tax=Physcomitrium patens TaxID=3218 RepID=A0A2K1L7E1_PHYPA|nr:hypothetical protein PHYPA_000346 [Physcomitrium patens]
MVIKITEMDVFWLQKSCVVEKGLTKAVLPLWSSFSSKLRL